MGFIFARARAALCAVAALAACACFGQQAEWAFRAPATPRIEVHGVANYDGAGLGTGAMLYPAPNVAGFVGALIAHGVLVGGMQSSARGSIQEKADEVAKPLVASVEGFTPSQLVEQGMGRLRVSGAKRLLEAGQEPGTARVVQSEPRFALTADRRALVMDNVVDVFEPGRTDAPALRMAVRVVSAPQPARDDASAWTADGGALLRDTMVSMWAESVDGALQRSGPDPDGLPEKTFHYLQGGDERFERARLLDRRCGRLWLRTLRGDLMVVPATEPDAACG